MFKTTVKYTDFLGEEREETLRFNLTEIEMQNLSTDEIVFNPALLAAIAKEKDAMAMYKVIQKLILHAYGELSEDGRVFRKSDQIRSDFANSMAYSEFLTQVLSSDTMITNFMLGVFPAKIAEEIKKQGLLDQKVIPIQNPTT